MSMDVWYDLAVVLADPDRALNDVFEHAEADSADEPR